MNLTYMAIERNAILHEKEESVWLDCGISAIRVESMSEGIALVSSKQFLFIVINADNIDYMRDLKILREATKDPILITTSEFTIKKQIEALQSGADFFWEFSKPEINVKIVTVILEMIAKQNERRENTNQIFIHEDIVVIANRYQVFIKGVEVPLTKAEMNVFCYFMANRGNILTHCQIYSKIYDDEYDEASRHVLYSVIKRLKQKLRYASGRECIENIKDIGYRIVTSQA